MSCSTGRLPAITATSVRLTKLSVKDLALGDALQVIEECRVGDTGAIGVANQSRAVSRQCGYGEGHGDAVIAIRLDFRAAQFSRVAAFDTQAVRPFFHGCSHAAQIF